MGEKGVLYIERVEEFKPLVVAVAEYGLIETVELFLEFGVEVQGTEAVAIARSSGGRDVDGADFDRGVNVSEIKGEDLFFEWPCTRL